MLQLTPEAPRALDDLRPTSLLPHHQMVRIARDQRSRRRTVRLTFVAVARPGDRVGESQGVAVCVGGDMADQVDGMMLDIGDDEEGTFWLRPVERVPRRSLEPTSATSALTDRAARTLDRSRQ